MKRLKLNSWSLGSQFDKCSLEAQRISIEKNQAVEYDFNEITCIVDGKTDLKSLWIDYSNAHLMKWKEVDGTRVYDDVLKAEISEKNRIRDEKCERQMSEYREKEKIQKQEFEEYVRGVEMLFKDKPLWEKGRKNNSDPYGGCVYDYAEGWAKLMQNEMHTKGLSVAECAEETSHKLGFYGITGFMYGGAVSVLSSCWIHGDDLRKWHNKEYNYDGDGTVNPAIITIDK